MSPRHKRHRRVDAPPAMKGFKPFGLPFNQSGVVTLHFEEYEALRLADYKKLSQEEAAGIMNVSRPTFTRIYDSCLKKIALAFTESRSIVIEGGDVQFEKEWFRCDECNHLFTSVETDNHICPECKSNNVEHINETIRNWRNKKYSSHSCVCPGGHFTQPRQGGIPCQAFTCPECGQHLVRQDK